MTSLVNWWKIKVGKRGRVDTFKGGKEKRERGKRSQEKRRFEMGTVLTNK